MSADPLALLPKGTFPLTFSAAMSAQLNPASTSSSAGAGGKRRKDTLLEEMYAFRYAFKPGSIGHETPGALESKGSGSSQMVFDSGLTSDERRTAQPAGQVFDVREEPSKPRECVLVYDESTKSFTLHPVPATLHLTLNRNASRRPASTVSTASASTTSSASVPLSRRPPVKSSAGHTHRIEGESGVPGGEVDVDADSFSSGDVRHEVSSMIGVEETPRPKSKRLKTDDSPATHHQNAHATSSAATGSGTGAPGRATKGGKGLPRKRPPMESAPIPVLTSAPAPKAAKTKGKATKGKTAASSTSAASKGKASTAKAKGKKGSISAIASQNTPTSSKIKSAEYIEDSDEEAASAPTGMGGEEDDEDMFARMVGESLAQDDAPAPEATTGVGVVGYGYDEDDDEEEESEDDEGLGGARLIVGGGGDDGSEWI